MITARDFLSTIITHPISTVVRATCLRTCRPSSYEILEIYAISNALLEDFRNRKRVVLLRSFAGVNRVLKVLLHQHLVAFGVAERLKWPEKLDVAKGGEIFR